MQTFSINTNVNNVPIDPFLALRALFGGNPVMHKLYAERDTGYGVCGLAVNMDRTKRLCSHTKNIPIDARTGS